MSKQKFGGEWSDEKLQILENYLRPYLQIFRKSDRTKFFTPHYVDGFAGCGTRTPRGNEESIKGLFDTEDDKAEAAEFARSSPRVALGLELSFSQYVFIENNACYANELQILIDTEYSARKHLCQVHTSDANKFLPDWCDRLKHNDRAVMLLDPYGTEINWTTIQAVARTKKVDVWILLPCSGILRMLPKDKLPRASWMQRLNDLLGTDRWQQEMYQPTGQEDLFESVGSVERHFTAPDLARWITRRLAEEFAEVVPDPLILRNSKNSPLFMLTFAAGNPKGAPIACRIARSIIETPPRGQ